MRLKLVEDASCCGMSDTDEAVGLFSRLMLYSFGAQKYQGCSAGMFDWRRCPRIPVDTCGMMRLQGAIDEAGMYADAVQLRCLEVPRMCGASLRPAEEFQDLDGYL